MSYGELLAEARKDVDAAIEVWQQLIQERLSDRIDYAVLKGSGIKAWESPVDYVPMISDIDIHIGKREGMPLFPETRGGFLYSLETTRLYEERFMEMRPDHLHIPRPQVVVIKEARGEWLPERPEEVKPLFGEVPLKPEESAEHLRARDMDELAELGPLLARLPEQVIDRIDLEYYRVLRMLCYVVSPTPIRVLSQFTDPKHVWTLNRTNVLRLLERDGLQGIAEPYREYYLTGWKAFTESFRDNETMRQLITHAYNVLYASYDAVREKVEKR
jgi:hypothetical protein